MPRKQKKFHLLYKTTNVITGKYYVGIHSTNDPFDDYKGSGSRLLRSVKKYGKENHVVEFLDIFQNREDLVTAEKNLVTRIFLTDPLCMNINIGGVAKPLNIGVTEETRRKISEAHKGRIVTWGDKISKARKGMVFSDEHKANISKVQKGRPLTEEWKINIGKGCKGNSDCGWNKRIIFVDGVEYESIAEASRITKIKKSTIGKRILSKNYKDTYYKDSPKE